VRAIVVVRASVVVAIVVAAEVVPVFELLPDLQPVSERAQRTPTAAAAIFIVFIYLHLEILSSRLLCLFAG
jgi:hypothetical protein